MLHQFGDVAGENRNDFWRAVRKPEPLEMGCGKCLLQRRNFRFAGEQEYDARADRVPAEAMPGYLLQLEQASGLLGYALYSY